jgi:hypothetical protein
VDKVVDAERSLGKICDDCGYILLWQNPGEVGQRCGEAVILVLGGVAINGKA